jgi:DNA-binding NarL/FixJ family response regulator
MLAASLLIADDHEVVRRGIRALIQEQPGWQIAAEVKDGRDAVAKADQFKPDVAILDIIMPSLNGLEAAKQIAKISPGTKILILTMHESDQLIHKILDAGARGYVLKTDAGRALISDVNALLSNNTFFAPKVAGMVTDGHLGNEPKASEEGFSQITGREREIVQLLAEGKGSKEVATILNLSVKTVETHRSNILRKLNCHSVT